ncbi:hypothetical protein E4U16_006036 [Claviceps sp. LM84 group G4]|nr:hypothetical protein E4U16_006036 [Claviceps sp. LM84 group G4]KAG6084412.1 hypothetical protein E4U33_003448 [Claviceps sp. LM78 group G4]
MATEEDGPPVTAGSPRAEKHACGPDEQTKLKRKLSLVEEGVGVGAGVHDHDSNDVSTKRLRQDARETSPLASEQPSRQDSPPQRRRSSYDTSRQGRESAMQEEKKRGKRLFGGLLSTLSQTSTTSQNKRRQEIEQRQQERLQKQREQDDQKRAEKLSKIREARLVEQVDFQEQVMRHRHRKLLALADFLKTKTEPAIYYLPWKRTADQEDIIDDQIRAAKSTTAKEEEEFKALKERHAIRYGLRRESHAARPDTAKETQGGETVQQEAPGRDEEGIPGKVTVEPPKQAAHQDAHDESGDVLVDAEEDMVIY